VQKYGWLGSVPRMREFVDERQPAGLGVYEYTISDQVWEASIAVERRALEDEQYDMVRMRVRDLAREAVRHKEQLVIEALLRGAIDGRCYDGQLLFDTDHQEGESGLQSNVYNGALSTASLQAAVAQMMQFKDDPGDRWASCPTLCWSDRSCSGWRWSCWNRRLWCRRTRRATTRRIGM